MLFVKKILRRLRRCDIKPLIDEVWLPIKMYEDLYEVSSLGRIRSKDREHLISNRHSEPYLRRLKGRVKVTSCNGPYETVSLYSGGKAHGYLVHRLVAIHFVPNLYRFPEVNHIDENKKNNRWDNLEWTTSSGNSLHSCYKTTGSKCGTSKLTEEQVLTIKEELLQGKSQTEIAKHFGVTNHCIFRIKAGDNWSWLTGFGKEVIVHAPIN